MRIANFVKPLLFNENKFCLKFLKPSRYFKNLYNYVSFDKNITI